MIDPAVEEIEELLGIAPVYRANYEAAEVECHHVILANVEVIRVHRISREGHGYITNICEDCLKSLIKRSLIFKSLR